MDAIISLVASVSAALLASFARSIVSWLSERHISKRTTIIKIVLPGGAITFDGSEKLNDERRQEIVTKVSRESS